ncbi:MAG: DUF1028 domain-containing protein [Acidimicrobiales bacterium]
MTYSIVARDPASGQLGVAAQSCYFALGRVLPWARAGVGAVATQAMVDPAYGPRCLDLLAAGVPAAGALARLRAADAGRELRQVALVSAQGEVASFTGAQCIDQVGHAQGEGYSAQANMMAGPGVGEAMAAAFASATGPLAGRLLAALGAAEDRGGDARGRMSAALLVVDGVPHDRPWEGVLIDVRVDHHPDPLTELARLVDVAEAYHLCDGAEDALVRGDPAAALAQAQAGLVLLPDDGNLLLGYIGALVGVGRLDEAALEVHRLVERRPAWAGILRAVTERGIVPLPDGADIETLLPPVAQPERPERPER